MHLMVRKIRQPGGKKMLNVAWFKIDVKGFIFKK